MPKASNSPTRRDDEGIAGHEILTLSSRDWEALLAALDDDRPRPELLAAVQRYRARRRCGSPSLTKPPPSDP